MNDDNTVSPFSGPRRVKKGEAPQVMPSENDKVTPHVAMPAHVMQQKKEEEAKARLTHQMGFNIYAQMVALAGHDSSVSDKALQNMTSKSIRAAAMYITGTGGLL